MSSPSKIVPQYVIANHQWHLNMNTLPTAQGPVQALYPPKSCFKFIIEDCEIPLPMAQLPSPHDIDMVNSDT